jgi:hypothetical protein
MSDDVTALIVTILIIALLFAWAPFLNVICPPCGRFLANWRMERQRLADSRIKRRSVAAVRH